MEDLYLQPKDYERAAANGIHARLLENRFYNANWEKERAITQPVHTSSISNELIAKAEANDVTYAQLRWRLSNTDLSEHEAATLSKEELFDRRIEKQSTYVTPAIKKLAEENNIKYQTVYKRIKNGMDPVKAATEQPLAPKDRVNKRWNKQARNK